MKLKLLFYYEMITNKRRNANFNIYLRFLQ